MANITSKIISYALCGQQRPANQDETNDKFKTVFHCIILCKWEYTHNNNDKVLMEFYVNTLSFPSVLWIDEI